MFLRKSNRDFGMIYTILLGFVGILLGFVFFAMPAAPESELQSAAALERGW